MLGIEANGAEVKAEKETIGSRAVETVSDGWAFDTDFAKNNGVALVFCADTSVSGFVVIVAKEAAVAAVAVE